MRYCIYLFTYYDLTWFPNYSAAIEQRLDAQLLHYLRYLFGVSLIHSILFTPTTPLILPHTIVPLLYLKHRLDLENLIILVIVVTFWHILKHTHSVSMR